MLDQRDRTIMELAGRVGYYQAEVEQLRTTLKALQAPSPEPDGANALPDAVATPQEPHRWWQRRLFG
jgi:hypothetical protein